VFGPARAATSATTGYDDFGQVISYVDADEASGAARNAVATTYDSAGRVHQTAATPHQPLRSSSTWASHDQFRGSGENEAVRLLAALKDPHRSWHAVVVGEGTRCWFGNQFSLIAPRFAACGVELWVPELGGKFDPRNPSHKMLMSVLGGMSESERQHVQARVRAAMDAQVINDGRHQGGRAPYGYVVVDGGPHPNPRKAAEGYRLRVPWLAVTAAPSMAVQLVCLTAKAAIKSATSPGLLLLGAGSKSANSITQSWRCSIYSSS
jgi:YD repeat-containing protein